MPPPCSPWPWHVNKPMRYALSLQHALLLLTILQTWLSQGSFSSPATCDNTCNSQQQQGFNFQDLNTGGFSSYGDLGFKGFSCAPSFHLKSKRTLGLLSGLLGGGAGASAGGAFGVSSSRRAFVKHV